jgi:adenylate cyclase
MTNFLLRPEENDLPPSVRAAVAAQQDKSERLIGWIQLAIIVTFGLLYAVARKTTPMHTIITPSVITLYFMFTVVRLFMAYRWRLNFWLLMGSILIDMGLLYGLIWSFHIQYHQPASFYLKVPTLLYVFIFIALRALRFEVRYVILAGLAAALGWLAMVGYVIFVDPHDNMITRDYVQYMTSNSILIGGEIDKIITMLMVTAILALVIHMARQLLTSSYAEGQAKQNLARFFDPEVARRIGRRGEEIMAGSGEARDVAILNLDLRGFTRMSTQLKPQDVMAILADYQSAMVSIIQREGGAIDKFLGDGIMATFGAVQRQEDYAARACRALEAAMAVSADWAGHQREMGRPALSVNGAVASGRVVVGAVGDESRLEFTVIGDAVNLSAKLEKHNKSIGTRGIVAADTYAAALAQGFQPDTAHRPIAQSPVAGLAQPMDLVALA